ncbi:Uncharacterized protein dnm_003900 [Desulfonema magnum]|uniref:Uncharacterized protein n=1 Tax=Desulfonema magnum TaxID=45655 RepID=A0A975BFG4_9BACT|nr:Uncharacterized protein dnm_003900 [Desulfonema magnum]
MKIHFENPGFSLKISTYAKVFIYLFSENCGETRLFPSRAADHSGKKAGFLPGQI